MPPSQTASQLPPRFQSKDTTHMLPRPSITMGERLPLQVRGAAEQHERSSLPRAGVGPVVGAIIIVTLLIFGGLYFWGAQLNKEAAKGVSTLFPPSELSNV